jgi:hypothetical protein
VTPRKTLSRLVVATTATAAIAVPAAVAKPIVDPPARAHAAQDLRSPDAADPSRAPARAHPAQDLRSPDAADPSRAPARVLPGPPTWPVNPQPIAPAARAVAGDDDDGIGWQVPVLAIAGAGIVFAGVGVTRVRIRAARPRIAA